MVNRAYGVAQWSDFMGCFVVIGVSEDRERVVALAERLCLLDLRGMVEVFDASSMEDDDIEEAALKLPVPESAEFVRPDACN